MCYPTRRDSLLPLRWMQSWGAINSSIPGSCQLCERTYLTAPPANYWVLSTLKKGSLKIKKSPKGSGDARYACLVPPRGRALDEIDYFKPVFISYNPHTGSGNYKMYIHMYRGLFFRFNKLKGVKIQGAQSGLCRLMNIEFISSIRAVPRESWTIVTRTFLH